MKNADETGEREIKFLRWSARVIGLLNGAFWLLPSFDPLGLELSGGSLAASSIATLLSGLVAWRRERVGGVMVILTGLARSIVFYRVMWVVDKRSRIAPALLPSLFSLTAGILFLICWWLSQGDKNEEG